ncbi:hypothetical protein DPSP01_009477 [Paraphaeosphaeria sporulosa]|uniref:Uncharacterized protein n=1 Tax=Paraphaeosphaeria sporulosa TaxID=1460663 RepID=A0A177C2V0_9PLEO|nr:uncharacterized protein CC84DRAFT_1101766 [Paraphaeosphaeria sporulosa]OAG01182.1 hypothetical protein CC84DRAFT_1101766 [Paraphaeosphaeria sporulosa]
MATSLLPSGSIALFGAPDSDIGSRVAKTTPIQAMQVDMTQDIVDELLESVRTGKPPHILFGRTPQLKYGDKTFTLQSTSETTRNELYHSSGTGSDDNLEFASLIKHSLVLHKAENVTAGVDSALEQLKNSMAAVKEMKEANKTVVGDMRNAGHRRVPSKGFVPSHLAPSGTGSPLLSVPSSPMTKRPPTSQPGGANQAVLAALRVPIIHLLAMQPAKESYLAQTCRTSVANVRDLLPKIAKHTADDGEKWQLTDKSFREIDPYKFPYKSQEDREQAINSAIKSFDRLRLSKEDKLWQILLPRDERGQGKCLSRLSVKAPEKPQKASTPLHKMSKLNEKKPAAKKAGEKEVERKVKDPEAKPKKTVKERVMKPLREPAPAKSSPLPAKNSPAPAATSTPKLSTTAPSNRAAPADANKIRPKKVAPSAEAPSPRVKPKMASRDLQQNRPFRPTKPVNTKPKNPSPLSASPPVNASDFEDSHPVHKALSGAPSPAKNLSSNSDRSLKRKANDLDSDIHNHNLAVKKPQVERSAPNGTPANAHGRPNGNAPSSITSLKRRSDGSSSSTPSTKVRKVNSIDTARAARYPQSSQISPGDSSSSQTSPTVPSLSFRQTVELSQKFQRYYKKYEALYWQLTESATPPSQAQRDDLLKMHKKLEEMKREIKAGAGAHR